VLVIRLQVKRVYSTVVAQVPILPRSVLNNVSYTLHWNALRVVTAAVTCLQLHFFATSAASRPEGGRPSGLGFSQLHVS
jgi:hypothetical protein